jgi:hypothetical protein
MVFFGLEKGRDLIATARLELVRRQKSQDTFHELDRADLFPQKSQLRTPLA